MTSPAFKINGGAVGVKASVAAGAAITGLLDNISGVNTVVWSVIRTDDTTTPSNYTLVASGSIGQQVDFNAGVAGTSGALQCVVNGGIDLATGQPSAAMTTTVKWYVPTASGLEVLSAGELGDSNIEASATHGAVQPLNAIIRGGGGGLGDWKESVRFATTAALAAHTGTGTLTASANGAFPVTDGVTPVAGDRMLVKDEGATDTEHGPYYFVQVGVGGVSPWMIRRVLDADTGAEMTPGTVFHVEEGTTQGGVQYRLVQTGTVTVDTTAISFSDDVNLSDTGAVKFKTGAAGVLVAGLSKDDADVVWVGAKSDGTLRCQYVGIDAANNVVLKSAGVDILTVGATAITCAMPPVVPVRTVAGAGSPAVVGQIIYVSNEAGGAVLAFSDGANWLRVTDRAVVS